MTDRKRRIVLALVSMLPAAALDVAAGPVRLGSAPLCEASALQLVPCRSGPGDSACAVVADNERKKTLFEFRIDQAGRLVDQTVVALSSPVEDMEAIAADEAGRLWIIGSHGRKSWKKGCAPDPDRLTLAIVRPNTDGYAGRLIHTDADEWTRLVKRDCARDLVRVTTLPKLATELCDALFEAERHATESKAKCAQAFNVEGAAALPTEDGPSAIWLGLRGPQLHDKAVMLRLDAVGDAPSFNGVATIDLEGRGIRELAVAGGWLWGIAGTAEDAATQSWLWRTRVQKVRHGAEIAHGDVEVLHRKLPPSSEGLAIVGDTAIVVVDGDKPDDGETDCETEPLQLTVPE